MSGPYITTVLSSVVSLNPKQMDNNIYKHLKENLIKKLEGKCFSKYGYVSKIYEILEKSKGRIIQENPMAAATFDVKFSCRLCHPIKKQQLICKIQKINKLFINASNGPITVIITMNRINSQVFYQDPKTNKLMARVNEGKSIEVTADKYIKVTIESTTFNDMDTIIMAMGELINLATDDEVKKRFEEEYGDATNKPVNFEKYLEGKDSDDSMEEIMKEEEGEEGEKEEKEEESEESEQGSEESEKPE